MGVRSRASSPEHDGPPLDAPGAGVVLRLRVILSGLLALQAGAMLVPGPQLWGVNHLAHVQAPLLVRLLWPVLGLILLWSPLPAGLGQLAVRPSRTGGGGRWLLLAQALSILCVGLLLRAFRTRTHFLGDGELLVELVSRGVRDHGFDFMTYHIHATLYQVLGLHGEQQAALLFAMISILSGMVYVAVAARGMRALFGRSPTSVLGFALLVLGPSTLLFFGYVECYGPLAVALLWFGISLVRHYRGDCSIYHAGLAFAVAVFLHPNALFLTPALIGLGLFPRDGLGWRARITRLVILLLFPIGAMAAGTTLLVLRGCSFSLTKAAGDAGGILLPLTGDGALFSLRHWKDLLNLLLLLAPVPLALLVSVSSVREEHARFSNEMKAFSLGLLGLGAVAAAVNMRIGMVRDWDILAPHAAFVALAALDLFARKVDQTAQASAAGLVVTGMIFLLVPWLAVNASSVAALERFGSTTRDLGPYARAYAHEEIARFERDRGNIAAALDEYDRSVAALPNNPRLQLARVDLMYRSGRSAPAIETLEACVRNYPTYVPALRALVLMHLEAGRPERALELSRAVQRLTTEGTEDAYAHGQAAERLGLYKEALEAYGWALNLTPLRPDIAQHLVAAMIQIEGVASTRAHFRKVLAAEPTSVAYICLALALWMPLRGNPELWSTPAAQADIREAKQLLASIPDWDKVEARMRNMKAELSTALRLQP
jgi:tetratricopeptide (TPR) repeat protein